MSRDASEDNQKDHVNPEPNVIILRKLANEVTPSNIGFLYRLMAHSKPNSKPLCNIKIDDHTSAKMCCLTVGGPVNDCWPARA